MPETVEFLPSSEILSFEEIQRVVQIFARCGINKLRLTGGEPLVRREVPELIRMLKSVAGIDEIAMTTNAVLLARHAVALKAAGLDRLNISLDTLDRETFLQLTRRDFLSAAIEGIDAARSAGFENTRLNAVSISGVTEDSVLPLARFARQRDLELRFIEFMPLDGDQNWANQQVLSGKQIREIIETEFGPLVPAERTYAAQPAMDYRYADGCQAIGFIDPVSEPFCSSCDRLRLTAEGQLRNCLFSHQEYDIRALIRAGESDESLESLMRKCVANKKKAHGIDSDEFRRPEKAMYQIGG